jgi:hypothetical protein
MTTPVAPRVDPGSRGQLAQLIVLANSAGGR